MQGRSKVVAGVAALALVVAAALAGAMARPASAIAPATLAVARELAPASQFMLPATEVVGIRVAEVSGLAWDADAQLLYGVSDQGTLYQFRLRRAGDAIVSVTPVFAAPLADPGTGVGTATSGKRFNAEGLALRRANDDKGPGTELVVALEERPPQIARFSPHGAWLGGLAVPAPANQTVNYRKKGRGLESVALHPEFGLMTAPESPLGHHPDTLHTVYANGHAWSFARHADGSRLKAIEVLADGNLLVLERTRPGSAKDSMVASLRRVDLSACGATVICKTTLVATLPAGPANFEGLTLLDARHALIASDNGGDPAQGTVFALVALP